MNNPTLQDHTIGRYAVVDKPENVRYGASVEDHAAVRHDAVVVHGTVRDATTVKGNSTVEGRGVKVSGSSVIENANLIAFNTWEGAEDGLTDGKLDVIDSVLGGGVSVRANRGEVALVQGVNIQGNILLEGNVNITSPSHYAFVSKVGSGYSMAIFRTTDGWRSRAGCKTFDHATLKGLIKTVRRYVNEGPEEWGTHPSEQSVQRRERYAKSVKGALRYFANTVHD